MKLTMASAHQKQQVAILYLLWMVDDTRDLFAVTFENGHDLLCVFIKYHSIFVIPSCKQEFKDWWIF